MGQEKSLPERYNSAPNLKPQNCPQRNSRPSKQSIPPNNYYQNCGSSSSCGSSKYTYSDKQNISPHLPSSSGRRGRTDNKKGCKSSTNSTSLSSSSSSSGLSRSHSSSSTFCSTCCSSSFTDTTTATTVSSSEKSTNKQTKYLDHHLYIKSYLDILEEDRRAKQYFQPVRPGIRNYTPKILSDKPRIKKEVDVWI